MMHLRIEVLLVFIAFCPIVLCCRDDANATDQCTRHPVANIINSFSNRLLQSIGGSGNLFYSPFGLSVSLGMVYLGTRGSTARQMEQALGYGQGNQSKEEAHDVFHDMLLSLNNSTGGEYSLLVASGLFVQIGYDLLPEFVEELKLHYEASVKYLDFSNDEEGAMRKINEWTSNNTHGQIKKLLEEPFDPLTVLVIMNAVYFKGFWKDPFSDQLTINRRFYRPDGSYSRVPFMENKKRVNFFKDVETNYTFLELDYKGDHVSMLFALPRSRKDFPSLELTTAMLCRIRSNLKLTEVSVFIPKFELAYERELSNDMANIGLTELFSQEGDADLSGMRSPNDLSVSSLIHKAVIDVNEQGSEASAVSGISFLGRSGAIKMNVFRADHPFLFCILEKSSGTILFMGRVTKL